MTSSSRRSFLCRALAATGAALVAPGAARIARALGAAVPSPSPPASSVPSPIVYEIHYSALRGPGGALNTFSVGDAVLQGASVLQAEDLPPLDALAELFPSDPAVGILVDARAGGRSARALAESLASSLIEMGSSNVAILDLKDDDLASGGYTVTRAGSGPRVHGTEPEPGWAQPVDLPGTRQRVRLSQSLADPALRIGIVARLSSGRGRMGPFVIDAALRAVDGRTRAEIAEAPELGAKLLASPLIAGRASMVIGDLIEIPLPEPDPDGARGGAAPDGGSKPAAADAAWKADEVLIGQNLFAVERIGYTILANTCKARRLPAPRPHPILEAAATMGLPGASLRSVDWRKVPL